MVRRAAGIGVLVLALAGAGAARAQEAGAAPALSLRLDRLDAQEGACRLTFVASNRLGQGIERLVAEAVLFDRAGRVAVLTLFDFAALPEGRQRVRQFDVAGLACGDLGQVLLNGVAACDGADPAACAAALVPESLVGDVEVTG